VTHGTCHTSPQVINGRTLYNPNQKVIDGNLPEKEVKKALVDQAANFPDGNTSLFGEKASSRIFIRFVFCIIARLLMK